MQNYPPPGQYPSPPPPAAPKSNKKWIIIGGVGCVVVLLIGLVVLLVGGYFVAQNIEETNSSNRNTSTTTTTTPKTTPRTAPTPGDDMTRYVNSPVGRTGDLEKNYVDFSFNYPDTWEVDPDPAPSYVRIERKAKNGNTVENFSVGWFAATGAPMSNRTLLSQVVNNLSTQISGNFPGYEKVSEGFTKIHDYDAYELKFKREAGQVAGGQLPYWGRVVVLTGDDSSATKGVSLIMLATGNQKAVKSVEDVGAEGELAGILDSFTIGASN